MPSGKAVHEDMSFRQRSTAALTHPATLGGIALILLNDLALKAMWPDAWLTGKLSDFAFVVFASPLLAFFLSLVVPDRARWGRAASLTAYAGLPLLYAAFNTFAAVHAPIIDALSLARGGPTYSPLDLTDSLVIPPALMLAIWVWRRPVPPPAVRRRVVLVVAAVAALGSIATSGPETELGIRYRQASVATPEGVFAVVDGNVLHDGEVVYTTDHLRRDEGIWLQARSTRHLDQRELTLRPHGMAVNDAGNVFVGMGIQGVLIRTADGDWTPRREGRYRPTDFSIGGKLRALFSDGPFLGLALSIATCCLVVAILIADFRLRRIWMIPAGLVLGVPLGAVWLVLFTLLAAVAEANLLGVLVVALVVAAMSALVMTALAGLQRTKEVLQYGLGMTALILCCLALVGFAHYPDVQYFDGEAASALVDRWSGAADTDEEERQMAAGSAGLILAIATVAGSRRRPRFWRAAAVAFLAVLALMFVAFLWWLLLDASLIFAKIGVGVLGVLVAIALGVHLRPRGQSEGDSGDPPPPTPRQPPVFLSRSRSTPPFLRPR